MIAVRVPDEIRKYKEKIVFGLTARQLICTIITLVICVPLYWFGRNAISTDILSWIILLIALPIEAVGFIKINGMPFEKFMVSAVEFEVLFPRKRKYKTENVWRTWQDEAKKLEQSKNRKERKLQEARRKEAALERTYLRYEAEQRGDTGFDANKADLVTLQAKSGKAKSKKDPKKSKEKAAKTPKKSKGAQVEERMKSDPHYAPSKADRKALKNYKKEQENHRKKVEAGKKAVKKKAKETEKRRKAKTVIPKSTQQSIPYIADYEEGVFEVEANKYSKMYRLKDINYRTGKEEEQVAIFCKLGEFLNYFSEDMHFAICIDNRVISKSEQERKVFKQMHGDRYDRHRKEYNNILRRQIIAGRNDMQVQKYITVTIDADSPIDAILRFHKIDAEVVTNLRRIGSDGHVLTTTERLEYYHDKYRVGHEGEFQIDFDFIKQQGISSKDYIAPSFMQFNRKDFQIEDEYYRVMFLNNLPASLADEFLFDLCDNDFPVITTFSIEPVAQDKALKIVRKQLTGIETNKIDAEKRAIKAGYSPETIQHSIKDAYAQAEMMYDDMLNKNQKMFFVTITMMVHGSTPDELEDNCKIVMGKARKYTTQLQVLTEQQEEGYKMTVPFGYTSKKMCVERALTTESAAIFMPFSNQELFQAGGFYYGLNQISQNLVIVNRTKMKTPSGFVLGSSGSGKSFATKREILNVLLDDDETNVLVIDPENEYGDFCRAFGGTVLKISSTSTNYINPLDMPPDYGLDEDDDPDTTPMSVKKSKALKKKSDYIMSIVERMISVGGGADTTSITPTQKTIVDECLRETYKDYLNHDFDPERVPTLVDLQAAFDRAGEKSAEAKQVADGVAYYTRGSMDLFAHRTNVQINNRLVVFNVRDLGGQLQQIGQIIVFDFIWNRMVENKNKGIRTYCYCDEIHTMFKSYYSADYLNQLYKRGRKYGLVITGITQDVEDLLVSEKARGMISNSDFIMMLNQSSDNLKTLAKMLNISETQMGFVTGADAGSGLLFAEKVIVPFIDRFPTDSYLYKLMSTKFGEEMTKAEVEREINLIMQDNYTEA
ncbi:MAG: PrgI family protein [Clostridiales bacterium]|nr:PrgI family protein [Clostridiales bacterium]